MARGIADAITIQLNFAKEDLVRIDPLMKRIGAIVAKECRKAFPAQRLGDIEWPARYEGMAEPFINIAGALADWNAGRKNPKPSRFQDRPALVDERNLWQSITSRPGVDVAGQGATVYVGTNRPYAALHQEGGWAEIPISDRAKDAIQEWLYKHSKKFGLVRSGRKVVHHGRSGREEKGKTPRSEYAKHVEPLLHMDVWRRRVARRPFIGVTDGAEREIRLEIAKYLKGHGVTE